MDTSNSQKNAIERKPIDQYVIKGEVIDHSLLSQAQCLKVLNADITDCSPVLKYFHGYKPLRDWFTYKLQDHPTVLYQFNEESAPVDINLAERYLGICKLSRVPGCNEYLLMNGGGSLLQILISYNRLADKQFGPIVFRAESANFQFISLPEMNLVLEIEDRHTITGEIMNSLYQNVIDTIAEKERHLEALRSVFARMSDRRSRIQINKSPYYSRCAFNR